MTSPVGSAFARARAAGLVRLRAAPDVPELALYLADELEGAWEAVGGELPYWAFAWAGGRGLARLVLDEPALVRGRRVVDFASGSGLVALAAARAGAREVVALELDPAAGEAIRENAAANGLAVEVRVGDALEGPPPPCDVLLAGDVFYERALAARALPWLDRAPAEVWVGDPGRNHSPAGLVAVREIPVTPDGTVERGLATCSVYCARGGLRPLC